jgi:zinc transporter ZupT
MDSAIQLFYADTLGFGLVFVCTVVGAAILLRKDRSVPAVMLSVGGVLAWGSLLLGDFIFIWITNGSLFIGEGDDRWEQHLAADGFVRLLTMASSIVAGIGFVFFVNRLPPRKTKPAESATDSD